MSAPCCVPLADRELWCRDLHWFFCHAAAACCDRSNLVAQLAKIELYGRRAERIHVDDGCRMRSQVGSGYDAKPDPLTVPASGGMPRPILSKTRDSSSWRRIRFGDEYPESLEHFERARRIWNALHWTSWSAQMVLKRYYEPRQPQTDDGFCWLNVSARDPAKREKVPSIYAHGNDKATTALGPPLEPEPRVRAAHRAYYITATEIDPRLARFRRKLAA